MVLEKTLERPSDCKEIQPVHPKGYQSWVFIGRTDTEAETPILWPPDAKNWVIWKDPDAGKDWRQEEKGTIEDEMVGWYPWLNGHEFEQALGVVMGREAKCAPVHGGEKSQTWLSDWTELNWNCSLSGIHRFMFITLQTLEENKNRPEKIRRQRVPVQAFASNGCTVLDKPL